MMAMWIGWLWLIAPPIGVAHYHHPEGLAIQDAYGVVVGTDGLVWIHSDNGLIRFDGSRFRSDTATAGMDVVVAQAIGDSMLVSFTFDHAAFTHPVDRMGGSDRVAFPDSLRPRSFLHAVGVRGATRVFGTTQSTLLVEDGGRWRSVQLPNRTTVPLRVPMVVPSTDAWIIGTTDGLWRWSDSGFEAIDERVRIVGKITEDGNGVWIPDRTHLYRWAGGRATRFLAFEGVGIRNVVTQAAWRHSDELWLSTLDEGLVIIRVGDEGTQVVRRELTSMKVSGVARAPDGSMWVTTLGNGVYRFHPWFDAFGRMDTPTDDAVLFAAEVTGFGMVVVHANQGVFVKRNRGWTRLIAAPVTDVDPVDIGMVVSSGEMAHLLRTDGGVTDLMALFRRQGRILNPPVKSAEWTDGLLYLALPIGVYEVDLEHEGVRRRMDGRVSVARRAPSGHWMVGRPDRIEIWSPDWSRQTGELPMGANDAVVHADGRFRVASPQAGLGILETDPMRWVPLGTGAMERIWALDDTLVVMVGPEGLFRWQDRAFRIPITPEGIAPGIRWAWKAPDGRVHLASRIGVITVDLAALADHRPKPVLRVSDVMVDGIETSRKGPVRLRADQRSVGITLALDGLMSPNRAGIRYRVDGGNWTVLPGMSLLKDGVEAGESVIDFQLLEADIAEPVIGTSLRVIRPAQWWERPLVRWSIMLLIAGCIAFGGMRIQQTISRRRIDRFMQEDRMRHMERMALTQLLTSHFLFNTLSTIRSVAERSADEVQAYVNRLARVIRSLIDRSYEPETDLATEMDWIRDYLLVEGAGRGIDFRITATGLPESDWEDVMLPSFVMQPLFENAVIHGRPDDGALEIRVDVERADARIRITLVNACTEGARPRTTGAGLRLVTDRVRGWARYKGADLAADEILASWQDDGYWHVRLSLPETVR